jgi:hypothetical protein
MKKSTVSGTAKPQFLPFQLHLALIPLSGPCFFFESQQNNLEKNRCEIVESFKIERLPKNQ